MKKEQSMHIIMSDTFHSNSFILTLPNKEEPTIVINNNGFIYNGELIQDSGEVYKCFKKFLEISLNK